MEGLFYYGVHAIEMVDAIWGPGVKRVSALYLEDRDLLDLDYHDGRYARLRMERKGRYDFVRPCREEGREAVQVYLRGS